MNTDISSNGLIPFKMCSATVSFDQFDPGWTLACFESVPDPEPKTFECWIVFNTPFSNVPLVQLGLTGFDIDNRDTAWIKITINGDQWGQSH
jgi:hypothetical protein